MGKLNAAINKSEQPNVATNKSATILSNLKQIKIEWSNSANVGFWKKLHGLQQKQFELQWNCKASWNSKSVYKERYSFTDI